MEVEVDAINPDEQAMAESTTSPPDAPAIDSLSVWSVETLRLELEGRREVDRLLQELEGRRDVEEAEEEQQDHNPDSIWDLEMPLDPEDPLSTWAIERFLQEQVDCEEVEPGEFDAINENNPGEFVSRCL